MGDEHPEQPPAQLVRNELEDVAPDVLTKLSERKSIQKTIRHTRCRNLPPQS